MAAWKVARRMATTNNHNNNKRAASQHLFAKTMMTKTVAASITSKLANKKVPENSVRKSYRDK